MLTHTVPVSSALLMKIVAFKENRTMVLMAIRPAVTAALLTDRLGSNESGYGMISDAVLQY